MTKAIIRLYLLHISAVLAVWAAMYYPGWDKFFSALYIFVLLAEIYFLAFPFKSRLFIAMTWSLPWIALSLGSVLALDWWGMGDIGFFILNCWYTPWLPWLASIKAIAAGYPLHYYCLLLLPLLNFILVLIIPCNLSLIKIKGSE